MSGIIKESAGVPAIAGIPNDRGVLKIMEKNIVGDTRGVTEGARRTQFKKGNRNGKTPEQLLNQTVPRYRPKGAVKTIAEVSDPKVRVSMRHLKRKSADTVKLTIAKYLFMKTNEMAKLTTGDINNLPTIDAMAITAVRHAINKKDFFVMEWLIGRLIGRQENPVSEIEEPQTPNEKIIEVEAKAKTTDELEKSLMKIKEMLK